MDQHAAPRELPTQRNRADLRWCRPSDLSAPTVATHFDSGSSYSFKCHEDEKLTRFNVQAPTSTVSSRSAARAERPAGRS
jgi:hypothetical protein